MTPVEKAIAALKRDGHEPRRVGAVWTAHCPGPEHDSDRWNRALLIAEAPDGRVILHCFGEWGAEDFLEAIGMRGAPQ